MCKENKDKELKCIKKTNITIVAYADIAATLRADGWSVVYVCVRVWASGAFVKRLRSRLPPVIPFPSNKYTMAPTKKREKDNVDCVGGLNGHNSGGSNGQGVDTTSNETLAVPTAATAASAAAAALTSTVAQETNAKLNGHQQEQELFLQAFESKFKDQLPPEKLLY